MLACWRWQHGSEWEAGEGNRVLGKEPTLALAHLAVGNAYRASPGTKPTDMHPAIATEQQVVWAWAFEASSIQSYIFDTGRMRDAVGASQIVDSVCGSLEHAGIADDLLSRVLAATGEPTGIRFSRRGGGAFVALAERREVLVLLRDVFALGMDAEAPGLEWLDALAHGATEAQAAQTAMRCMRNARLGVAADLVEAGPWVVRNRRSGRPAISGPRGANDFSDAATAAKRQTGAGNGTVARWFGAPEGAQWPLKLTPDDSDDDVAVFPFRGEQHELAFVHADGNGLGAALLALDQACRDVPEIYVQLHSGFSSAITRATRAAAHRASLQSLYTFDDLHDRRVPARPLVLGGDDLGIIVRPDKAFSFVAAFLRAFEDETAKALGVLRASFPQVKSLPDRLTAAAGIAIVDSSYPFGQAAELAESLCAACKRTVKAEALRGTRTLPLSALMFHRLTSALPFDDDDPLAGLRTTSGSESLSLVAGPYGVNSPPEGEPPSALPEFAALERLATCLAQPDGLAGPARELLGMVGHHDEQLRARWRSARKAASRRATPGRDPLQEFDEAMRPFGIGAAGDLPFALPNAEGIRVSPLLDALVLQRLVSQGAKATREDPSEEP